MFDRHRQDLKEAQAHEREALNTVIRVLADQVDFLRWQISQKPHMSPVLQELQGFSAPDLPEDFKPYLSEEEEDILAMRLSEHLDDQDIARLAQVIPLHTLEADE